MNRILCIGLCSIALNCIYAAPHNAAFLAKPNLLLNLQPLIAPEDVRIDLQKEEVFINADQTYETLWTYEKTLLTSNGLLNHQTMTSPSYFPGHTSVELIDAYTLQSDGTKIEVPTSNIFTTTSPADPAAPGFVTSLQQHVAFPQLKIGSKLHVKWRYKQLDIPLFNFADVISPDFTTDTLHTEMSVNVPKSMYIKWAKEGDFQVKEVQEADRHIISAVLGPYSGHKKELFMTASSDRLPFFEVSTILSWEEIGNTLSKLTTPSQAVTPAIEELVATIVGGKKGKEAARAIYNWTANNITYLETSINPQQGLIPPKASEIIANRFGDCKGHSCVLQTLLKVIGIESYPVLVNWDNSLKQYPLPILNFDHEMVFVPSLNLFLNPTDQYSSFDIPLEETNFDPRGTQVLAYKPVIIAKPQGSILTKTPEALSKQNQYHIASHMKMTLQGDVQAQGKLSATGCFANLMRGAISSGPLDDVVNSLVLNNGIKGHAVAKATAPGDLDSPMAIEYAWNGLDVAQHFQEELLFQIPIAVDFFTPEFFKQYISASGSRDYPLIIGASIYNWDYTIEIPTDYQIGKQPSDVNITNAAGSYSAIYKIISGALQIHRTLILNKNVYQPDEYVDVSLLLMQLLKDRDGIFSFAPSPVKNFPGYQKKPETKK